MAPSLMISKVPLSPFRVMVVVVGVAAICLVFSAIRTGPQQKLGAVFQNAVQSVKQRDVSGRTMADSSFWKNVNLTAQSIPAQVIEDRKKVVVKTNTINIMGTETFYRDAEPPVGVSRTGEVVVLLHGAAFKSETWLKLGTINYLAAMGHRVVAIDLPGYGETTSTHQGDKGDYLQSFLTLVKVNYPILVSPSMSGGFSFPFILKHPEGLAGFVPVAPVMSEKIKDKASDLMIPTLIIYGEKDKSLGVSSTRDLINIPTSQKVVIPKGSHPAYLDDPDLFHTLLYNFIKQIHANRASS